jgi:hypothetical protein
MTEQPQTDIPEPQVPSDDPSLAAAAPTEQPNQIVTGDAVSPPVETPVAPIPDISSTPTDTPTIEAVPPTPDEPEVPTPPLTPPTPPVTPTETISPPAPQEPDPIERLEGEGGPPPPAAEV